MCKRCQKGREGGENWWEIVKRNIFVQMMHYSNDTWPSAKHFYSTHLMSVTPGQRE